MDCYNEFFFRRISPILPDRRAEAIGRVSYQEPLSIVIYNAFGIGNFNASLFATESVASVGPSLRRAAFACRLVIALKLYRQALALYPAPAGARRPC